MILSLLKYMYSSPRGLERKLQLKFCVSLLVSISFFFFFLPSQFFLTVCMYYQCHFFFSVPLLKLKSTHIKKPYHNQGLV